MDGKIIKDSKCIVNSMNDYFCSVGDKLSKEIPNIENRFLKGEYYINPTAAYFSFSPMQPQKVINALNKFKTSHGSGLDGIPALS